MKVAVYCRESDKDTKKAPPIEEQIKRGRQWCEENNHDIVHVFADNGYSGGDWKRPEWNKAIRLGKRHDYQILWTWDQDRIARDTEQFLWFYRQMKTAKVKVFSMTDGFIDMETLGGRVKHTSMAMAHEIFRVQTSEKVKKTYEMKKAKADKLGEKLKWGRPRKEVDHEEIRKLYDTGMGYRKIANVIGVSYQTIRRVLHNTHPDFQGFRSLKNKDMSLLQNNPILERVNNCPPADRGIIEDENQHDKEKGSEKVQDSRRGELS